MKNNTKTAALITLTIGISAIAMKNVSAAEAPLITIASSNISAEHRDAHIKLVKGIKKALKKHDKLSAAQKAKASCPKVYVSVNPGVISKALFSIALREVRKGVNPNIWSFNSMKIKARWQYQGKLERVCVFANGNSKAASFQPITLANVAFPVNLGPKPTTSLYVQ